MKRGAPKKASTRVVVSVRLDPAVAAFLRSQENASALVEKLLHQEMAPADALLGSLVDVTRGFYKGHWGTILAVSDGMYTISGGSIGNDLAPILSRNEFRVRKENKK